AEVLPRPAVQLVDDIEGPQTFLLEIGSEELPVGDLASAIVQLRAAVPEMLDDLRLPYDRVEVDGTPRRLVVLVHWLATRQRDLETQVKGPPADRAFDAAGIPTKAALGFARSRGVDVADLRITEEDDKRYVTAVVREEGRPAVAVLAEALPELIATLKFERSMRWNETNVNYSRPLRWIVALYGPDVVPFRYAGVTSGRTSRGLRPYGSPPVQINDAMNYVGIMRNSGVIISEQRRKELIMAVATKLAAEKQGAIPDDPALLAEVANLVERPTPLRGRFSERFLELPAEVLVAVMRKHQRYFPIYDDRGKLLPYFIAVRNGDEKHLDIVVEGNEQVLRARFADAEFFYNNDVRHKLADFLPGLATLTFQADLGSVLDKVHRLEKLTPIVARLLGLTEEETAVATRAAALSKADLATSMVVEMTLLQGVMGGHYARLSGESEAVATAIAEQYEAVSHSRPGLALAIADRLDSLVGLFTAGLAPKGSNDPFALRRAALHLIENLVVNQVDFDLRLALAEATTLLPIPANEAVLSEVMDFIEARLEGVLREQGYPATVVKAVLAEQRYNPYAATRTAVNLSQVIKAEGWAEILDAYARCVRITRDQPEQFPLHPEDYTLEAERNLLAAYQAASASDRHVTSLVASLREMVPAINIFFEDVLVMAEDPAVRQNRLALLQRIASLTEGVADFSYLEGF
ncbi:MAG TPA: glycine--tRNA ligase subunit beta, partial [Anaerolineae bacterium]